MNSGNFLGARVAYERAIFEGASPVLFNELLLKKADCWKQEGKFMEAYEVLQRANATDNRFTQFQVLYESALTAYLQAKGDLALGHIQELRYYFPDTTVQMIDLLEILSLNELSRWQDAQIKFSEYSDRYALNLNEHLYDDIIQYKLKKPSRAVGLSFIFPGSGQMYSGYFFRGLTSTVINTGWVLFTIYSFSHGFYLSGAFTGVAFFHLFYNGGANYARSLANKRNDETTRDFKRKANSLLLGSEVK